MKTWDGQQLLNRGFTKVEVSAEPALGGGYKNIEAIWTK